MDKKKAIEAGIALGAVAVGAGLYYEYKKGTKFPITNPKPIFSQGANVSQGGTAQVYEQVNYPTSATVQPSQTPTTTVTPQPPPVKPTGTSTSQVTSGQIIECPKVGSVKTEYGLVPCTPGYKYYDLNGALFEYEFYSIAQEAMATNSWGALPDVDILQEAYDYLVNKNRNVTTATICYSFLPLGMFSKASFQPNAFTDVGDTSKPYLPSISICKGDNNTYYQLASSHVRANYFYNEPNYFASMTVYGDTITTDPFINFPTVQYLDTNGIVSNTFNETTLFIVRYTDPLWIQPCAFCFPHRYYLHDPFVAILGVPGPGESYYFADRFRGIPSLSTQPPINFEWTVYTHIYYLRPNTTNYHVSYNFVDARMYYEAKHLGQPVQPGTVSYNVLYYALNPPYGYNPPPPPYTGNHYDEPIHFNGYAIWWD